MCVSRHISIFGKYELTRKFENISRWENNTKMGFEEIECKGVLDYSGTK
jgi:hypothetical protein